MNYLWEVMLLAAAGEIPAQNMRFQMARQFCAYMEVSTPYLNQDRVEKNSVIDVNPYYRFYEIFKGLFQPEMKEFKGLRESLTNLIFHQLAGNDVLSGMTREEYYKKLLYQDFLDGMFGKAAMESMRLFSRDEREVILSGLLRQYETGSSLDLFKDMMEELIPGNIVYRSNEDYQEIFVYIRQRRETRIVKKMKLLTNLFVEIPYYVELYYEHHFGIIGIEETMQIDEIALC